MKKWMALYLILLTLSLPTAAEEPADYCFSSESLGENLTGIYLVQVPNQGELKLKQRILRPGDVVAQSRIQEMTYYSPQGLPGTLHYLPISQAGVLETASFLIPGRKNQAPVAEDSALETYQNLSNRGKLRLYDPEEEALTVTVLREPKRGSLQMEAGGSFTYTPEKNKVGTDYFTYQARDPQGNLSREARVTITILKPSDHRRYQDTAGLDCEFSAEWMKNTGIFQGEILGDSCCFGPEKPVSRGEFLAMLLKTLHIPGEPGLTENLQSLPRWLRPYGAAALRAGISLPDWEDFSAPMEVSQAAAMAGSGLELPASAGFYEACQKSQMEENSNTMETAAVLTRAQAAELLYQVHLNRLGK